MNDKKLKTKAAGGRKLCAGSRRTAAERKVEENA
ncbi:hypothetical protein IMSAG249_02189 [Lachnospiraceae bacterium]|jgi:hypothetical protein|nr:hypothetical protein IMSAGC009_01211 [Lachnospiraceae bacterium]GFI70360.1 hypothetical protein IMSAG249_02189 [Lachnospiraceae bacterium]